MIRLLNFFACNVLVVESIVIEYHTRISSAIRITYNIYIYKLLYIRTYVHAVAVLCFIVIIIAINVRY
jgi:hypothetical protein